MEYLGQEGYILYFDEIDEAFEIGGYLSTDSRALRIVYIDRDKGELGCLPASKKMEKKIRRIRSTGPDGSGAGDA